MYVYIFILAEHFCIRISYVRRFAMRCRHAMRCRYAMKYGYAIRYMQYSPIAEYSAGEENVVCTHSATKSTLQHTTESYFTVPQ